MILIDCNDNHISDEVWLLSRTEDVFITDRVTGELIQVLDLTEDEDEES